MKKLLSLLVAVMLIGSFNMCLAEESDTVIIKPMPIDPPISYPGPIELLPYVKGTISITEGWNLIAMPVLPVEPYTVEAFIKNVESPGFEEAVMPRVYPPEIIEFKPNWNISVVAVYKNGEFERYPKEGVTYNMVPGEAYFVYAEYNGPIPVYMILEGYPTPEWHPRTTVTVVGRPIDVPVSLNLSRGWNGVSLLCKSPEPIIDDGIPDLPSEVNSIPIRRLCGLQQLSEELVAQGIRGVKIAFWAADRQEWEIHKLPLDNHTVPFNPWERPFILDRIIRADEGFFLLTGENGLYIPGLATQTKPPVDGRVNYTGYVQRVENIPASGRPYGL